MPGRPDDVAESLLAVYLRVCRYQHSLLEFSGTTVFYPPPPPYLNISNQSIRLGSCQGCGCQTKFALEPVSYWLVFQALVCIQIVISALAWQTRAQVGPLEGEDEAAVWFKKRHLFLLCWQLWSRRRATWGGLASSSVSKMRGCVFLNRDFFFFF